MSIVSRMEAAKVLKPVYSPTVLQTKVEYEEDRVIQISLSFLAGAAAFTTNQLYTESTHTGLTTDRGLTVQNRLLIGNKTYTITYVNNDGARYSVIFMKQVS